MATPEITVNGCSLRRRQRGERFALRRDGLRQRPRTRQQFRLRVAERRKNEIDRRCQETDTHHYPQIAKGTLQQLHVERADSQADAVDRTHQRRDQHGADDDRRGVDIQPDGRDNDGEKQNPDVDAAELDRAADGGNGRLDIGVIVNDQQGLEPAPHGHYQNLETAVLGVILLGHFKLKVKS